MLVPRDSYDPFPIHRNEVIGTYTYIHTNTGLKVFFVKYVERHTNGLAMTLLGKMPARTIVYISFNRHEEARCGFETSQHERIESCRNNILFGRKIRLQNRVREYPQIVFRVMRKNFDLQEMKLQRIRES